MPPDAVAAHRQRMALILHVPALQAHSTLRYAEWRDVVAPLVARRTGTSADSFDAQLVGHLALGAAVAAYEEWLRDERSRPRRPAGDGLPNAGRRRRRLTSVRADGDRPAGPDYGPRTIAGEARSSLAITMSAPVIGSHSSR